MLTVLALAVASYTGPAIGTSRVAVQMVAGPKKSSKPAVGMPSLKDLQSMKNWGAAKPAPKKKNPSIKLSDDVTTEVARQARRASAAATPALDMLRDAAAKAQKKAEDKIYLRDAEAKIDTSAAAMAARALLLLKDNKVIKKLPEPEPEEPYVPKTYLDRATEEKLPTVPQSTLRAAAAATAGYVLWATLIAPAGAPREDLALTRQLESAQEMAGQMRLVDGYNTRAKAQLAIASAAAERAAAANEVEATGLAEAAALVAQTNGELDTAVASLRAYDKEAKIAETRLQRTVEAALAATQKKCAAPPSRFCRSLLLRRSPPRSPLPRRPSHARRLPLRYDALLSLNAADSEAARAGYDEATDLIASSRELGVMKQRLINFRAEGTAAMQVHARPRATEPALPPPVPPRPAPLLHL